MTKRKVFWPIFYFHSPWLPSGPLPCLLALPTGIAFRTSCPWATCFLSYFWAGIWTLGLRNIEDFAIVVSSLQQAEVRHTEKGEIEKDRWVKKMGIKRRKREVREERENKWMVLWLDFKSAGPTKRNMSTPWNTYTHGRFWLWIDSVHSFLYKRASNSFSETRMSFDFWKFQA